MGYFNILVALSVVIFLSFSCSSIIKIQNSLEEDGIYRKAKVYYRQCSCKKDTSFVKKGSKNFECICTNHHPLIVGKLKNGQKYGWWFIFRDDGKIGAAFKYKNDTTIIKYIIMTPPLD
jgi:hypothetical protein